MSDNTERNLAIIPPIVNPQVRRESLRLMPTVKFFTDGATIRFALRSTGEPDQPRIVLVEGILFKNTKISAQFGISRDTFIASAETGLKRNFLAPPVQMGSNEAPEGSLGIVRPEVSTLTVDAGLFVDIETGVLRLAAGVFDNQSRELVEGFQSELFPNSKFVFEIGARIRKTVARASIVGHGQFAIANPDGTIMVLME